MPETFFDKLLLEVTINPSKRYDFSAEHDFSTLINFIGVHIFRAGQRRQAQPRICSTALENFTAVISNRVLQQTFSLIASLFILKQINSFNSPSSVLTFVSFYFSALINVKLSRTKQLSNKCSTA